MLPHSHSRGARARRGGGGGGGVVLDLGGLVRPWGAAD